MRHLTVLVFTELLLLVALQNEYDYLQNQNNVLGPVLHLIPHQNTLICCASFVVMMGISFIAHQKHEVLG